MFVHLGSQPGQPGVISRSAWRVLLHLTGFSEQRASGRSAGTRPAPGEAGIARVAARFVVATPASPKSGRRTRSAWVAAPIALIMGGGRFHPREDAMPLEVIGAGLGRTGTLSLKVALE